MNKFSKLNDSSGDLGEFDRVSRKRVLLALDDKPTSRRALDYILESPWANDCELRLITVVEPVVSKFPDGYSALYSNDLENDDEIAKATILISEFMRELQQRFSEIKVQSLVAEGAPAECIVEAAKDWADLIVIGGRRRSIIDRLWNGSVSQEVVKKADCAVEVVVTDSENDDRLGRFLKANSESNDHDLTIERTTTSGTKRPSPASKTLQSKREHSNIDR